MAIIWTSERSNAAMTSLLFFTFSFSHSSSLVWKNRYRPLGRKSKGMKKSKEKNQTKGNTNLLDEDAWLLSHRNKRVWRMGIDHCPYHQIASFISLPLQNLLRK